MTHYGDMAHLPGGGPPDTRCGDCDLTYVRGASVRCTKAAELRRVPVMKLEPIIRNQASCKFFQPSEEYRKMKESPACG